MPLQNDVSSIYFNVNVPAASFVPDQTYSLYPYRAAISLSAVNALMFPEIFLDFTDANNYTFSPVAETYNGGIYIYSEYVPPNDIKIATIILWKN